MIIRLTRILNSYLALALQTAQREPRPDNDDVFAQPRAYRAWLWPLRRILALRYLSVKDSVLTQQHLDNVPPISHHAFAAQLQAQLGVPAARVPFPLRPFVLFTALTLALVSLVSVVQMNRQRQRLRDQLLGGLLAYSSLVHEQTASRQYERILSMAQSLSRLTRDDKTYGEITATLWMQKGERSAKTALSLAQRNQLLGLFDGKPYIRSPLEQALDSISNDRVDVEGVVKSFGQVNRSFHQSGLPYYLVPTVLGGPCASFLDLELRTLIKEDAVALIWPGEQKVCRTTLVIPYEVLNRTEYRYRDQTFPVYKLQRLGRVELVENALGLTYHDGEGSELHGDRIRRYAIENILPALTPQGRSVMFPWLRSSWQVTDDAASAIEESLRNIYSDRQRGVLRSYAEKLVRYEHVLERARLHQTLLAMGHRSQPRNDQDLLQLGLDVLSSYKPQQKPNARPEPGIAKPDLLNAEADELRRSVPAIVELMVELLQDAVAYHEVQHQLHDRDAQPKRWLDDRRWKAIEKPTSEGVAEEVAAYLVEINYGPKIRHIVLTQLASFALSVLEGSEREYQAGQIVLAAMLDAHHDQSKGPRYFSGPLDLLAGFQTLRRLSDDRLAELARGAYLDLMGEALPDLKPGRR